MCGVMFQCALVKNCHVDELFLLLYLRQKYRCFLFYIFLHFLLYFQTTLIIIFTHKNPNCETGKAIPSISWYCKTKDKRAHQIIARQKNFRKLYKIVFCNFQKDVGHLTFHFWSSSFSVCVCGVWENTIKSKIMLLSLKNEMGICNNQTSFFFEEFF